VLAVVEYETWFVASASSLQEYLHIEGTEDIPEHPELRNCGKKWIEDRFSGMRYNPRVDQPKLTAKMDLRLCRERSPSFDRLCRELERFVSAG